MSTEQALAVLRDGDAYRAHGAHAVAIDVLAAEIERLRTPLTPERIAASVREHRDELFPLDVLQDLLNANFERQRTKSLHEALDGLMDEEARAAASR